MENWKNLNDLEKVVVNRSSNTLLTGLKEIIIKSNIFTNNTHEDFIQYGHHFIGKNIIIRWYDYVDSLTFYITKIKKKEIKSFWNTRIEEIEDGQFYLQPFAQKEHSIDWDFDDFYEPNNSTLIRLTEEEKTFLDDVYDFFNDLIIKIVSEYKQQEKQKSARIKDEKEKLKESKKAIIQKLDSDNNGEIDLIENDFPKLLSKYQKQIVEIDKNYIHKFVKISAYIGTKKNNIQTIFKSIEKINSKSDLNRRINLLKNQIYTYDLIIFHSLNMIEALVSEDLITFYEIYEKFDKIGIFNSNWENEVSNKLTSIGSSLKTIGNKLDTLLSSIAKMEENIVSEIGNMNYSTQESFSELNESLTSSLKSINSSIDVNNLFTAINTYQLYKINKQTKPLLNK